MKATEKEIFEAIKGEFELNYQTPEQIDQNLLPDYKKGWLKLMWFKMYLRRESKQGKTEFRLVLKQDGTYMIHPLGQDGETLDFEL